MEIIIPADSVINGKIQLWVPFDIHRHAKGKLMACTPFLPVDMVQGNDVILRMYIHEDIPYVAEKIKEEEEQLLNRQVHPKRCFDLAPESSDLQIECNGRNVIISAKELFNRQENLVSMPITTEPNTRMQMISISMSTKDNKVPTTSMSFMAILTDFSTDWQSTLDEIITASDTENREKDTGIEDVITKDMNTDKYYHLGIALGLSYETLDSIQASIRGQKVEAGVYTSNQRAAIIMIRYWKHLQHPDSQADDHLREVWSSVTNSRKPDVPVKQASSLDETVGSTMEEIFEDKSCGARPLRREGFYDIGTKIPSLPSILGTRGHWEERFQFQRSRTPSIRSDSSSSTLREDQEDSFPRTPDAYSSIRRMTSYSSIIGLRDRWPRVSSVRRYHERDEGEADAYSSIHRVASYSSHIGLRGRRPRHPGVRMQHERDTEGYSEQDIVEWMESGEVKPADSQPDRSAATPLDGQKGVTEPVNRISSMSGHHDEVPVQGFDSQMNVNDETGIIRLEEYGIEVHVPSGEAYSAKDITVDAIDEVPPDLLTVLRETGAIITVGLKMSPSDASFERPVKVTMPHCGVFRKPESAQIVTYYRKNASDSFTAIPSTKKGLQCIVRQRDLDIYLNHFSESWIVALFKWAFIGKRVICTPYIPVSTPKNKKHVLRLHVRDENFPEGKIEEGYKAATTGNYFFVRWRYGGLHITCPESTMNGQAETIDESKITHLSEHKVSFIVDTRNSEDDDVILQFIIKQCTIEKILVTMCLQGETTQEQAFARPISPGIQPTLEGETSECRNSDQRSFQEMMAGHVLSDAILLNLSKQIDSKIYPVSEFAIDLGFDSAIATSAQQMSTPTTGLQTSYKFILDKFVMKNGRDAQKLIDVFIVKEKQLLVDLIKEALLV